MGIPTAICQGGGVFQCFPANQLFATKAEARREIFEYIEVYYNNQRLHCVLG
jgi:transposase InsO family protein